MKNTPVFSWLGTALTGVFTYLSAVELKDLISWILSILAAIVTIAFTIWSWYKKASKDGKITKDEVGELVDDVSDKVKDFKKKEEHDGSTK